MPTRPRRNPSPQFLVRSSTPGLPRALLSPSYLSSLADHLCFPVVIKHQGTRYNIDLDLNEPGAIFKYQVYSLTGVEPENQTILLKGIQVKDETDLSKISIKPGHSIMVLGQPGPNPVRLQAPTQKPRFLEDAGGAEATRQDVLATPGGLGNLGNTCYLNAPVQALRSIPELQEALVNLYDNPRQDITTGMVRQLREVFLRLSSSHATFVPHRFLNTLRALNPRFAERARNGTGYAQQDAEEAWTYMVNDLQVSLMVPELLDAKSAIGHAVTAASSSSVATADAAAEAAKATAVARYSVIKRFLTGEMQKTLVCDEAEGRTDAQLVPTQETFLTLPCHITISINHLMDGLVASMSQKITKQSDVLGRDASFTETVKLSRLPKYLTIHFMRFFWKRDVQKKAKIMRKVTFPYELDMSEMCTDELRAKLLPIREKVREIRKDIDEIERTKKKRKRRLSSSGQTDDAPAPTADAGSATDATATAAAPSSAADPEGQYRTDAQIDAEKLKAVHMSKVELLELVKDRLEEDRYSNHTGLYELRAVVAHQGASADSGHYTAFVKKGTILNPKNGRMTEEDGNWWWFNDDVVTEVTSDRIDALAGGGESHSALILLYGSVPLPLPKSELDGKFTQS